MGHDGVARIAMAGGFVVLVDAADLPLVNQRRWHAKRSTRWPGRVYAQATVRLGYGRAAKKANLVLHRLIAGAAPREIVDHINGDTLDNRRANLRICSARENSSNVTRSKNQKNGRYKGVHWNIRGKKWEAAIGAGEVKPNGKRRRLYLGLYADPADAARAYDAAARKHFGAFAAVNFPEES